MFVDREKLEIPATEFGSVCETWMMNVDVTQSEEKRDGSVVGMKAEVLKYEVVFES